MYKAHNKNDVKRIWLFLHRNISLLIRITLKTAYEK